MCNGDLVDQNRRVVHAEQKQQGELVLWQRDFVQSVEKQGARSSKFMKGYSHGILFTQVLD